MTNEDASFDILLDRQVGIEVVPGLISGAFELRGRQFPTEINNGEGIADSIDAVQKAGLLQVPSYALIRGRAYGKKNEPVWSRLCDTLGERMVLEVPAEKYSGVQVGVYVVDLVGAGLFMSNPNLIRETIRGNKLVNKGMPISDEMKSMLLGDKSAYRWNGRELKQVPVQVFDSYAAFEEVSGDKDFKGKLVDLSAVYAVLRPVAEAQRNPSEYRYLGVQATNPDLVIPAGGKAPLQAMFAQAKSFKWEGMGSYHNSYQTTDTGRPVVLYDGKYGVGCGNDLSGGGRSVGVAPEALNAQSVALENVLDSATKYAIDKGLAFERSGYLYVPTRASNFQINK